MCEGERFVGVNHVDDIVVLERGRALDEFGNGVPLDIAKEDGSNLKQKALQSPAGKSLKAETQSSSS